MYQIKSAVSSIFFISLFVSISYCICPIDPCWRDPDPSPNAPRSPPLITSVPQKKFTFYHADQWSAWGPLGAPGSLSNGKGESNGINVSDCIYFVQKDWHSETEFFILKHAVPLIKAGVSHTFNLQFLLSEKMQFGNTIKSINMHLVPYFQTVSTGDDSQVLHSISNSIYSYSWIDKFDSTSCWMNLTHTFNPTTNSLNVLIILQLNLASKSRVLGYYFKNASLLVDQYPIVIPPDLPSYQELVKIPKPPSNEVPQDRKKCPHLRTDLKHWHDPETWPNKQVPSPNSDIILPNNTRVLISSCSFQQNEVYKRIVVPFTSELVFSDGFYEFHVRDICVFGKLWMGSKECRLNGNITIVFHGAKTNESTIFPGTGAGSKGIVGAPSAFVSIQGKRYFNTWTRLASTIYPGDFIISLQDPVNWEVGQKVFITTSQIEDEFIDQNEVVIIAAVSENGKMIQFTKPVKYYHYAGPEYQSEVGLISRRITLRGADDSDEEGFGGHVMLMGEGQFAGVTAIKMGQLNVIGKYPFHFHLSGTVKNSYVTDCSVYKSYFRCFTIHGTNNLTVSENIGFDSLGNCFFIEDGVEENNTLSYNLAANIHVIGQPAGGEGQGGEFHEASSDRPFPPDATSAGFYIPNAYNRFIGNAASGGWTGFLFINLYHPIQQHINVSINPSDRPLLEWNGNTAHSSGYFWKFGSTIYVGGLLWEDSNKILKYITGRKERDTLAYGTDRATPLKFFNTKMFLTTGQGISHWGTESEVVGFETHDCGRSSSLYGKAWLSNGIVNGQSNNPLSNDPSFRRQGVMILDSLVQTILTNINFRNFIHNPSNPAPDEDNVVFTSLTYSDQYKPQGNAAGSNITYTNVEPYQILGHLSIDTGSSRQFNFIDWDGSATLNHQKKTLVGSHIDWWNYDKNCKWNPNNMGVWVCSPKRPEVEIATLEIIIPGLIYYSGDYGFPPESRVGSLSLFGNGITDRRQLPVTKNPQVSGVSNMGWYLNLDLGSPVTQTIHVFQVPHMHWIMYSLSYPAGTTFNISTHHHRNPNLDQRVTQVNSLSSVLDGNGLKYYFDQKHLYIKIVDLSLTGSPTEYYERDNIRVYNSDLPGEYFLGLEYSIKAYCPQATIAQLPGGGAVCCTSNELPYY